jgi:hypothetical protein
MNKLTPGSDFGGPATSDEEYQPNGIRSSGSVPAPASSSGSQLANTIDEAVLKPWGLMGLTRVLKMSDKDLTVLSLGTDLTTLGLNLSSPEYAYIHFRYYGGANCGFPVYYMRLLLPLGLVLHSSDGSRSFRFRHAITFNHLYLHRQTK